MLTKLEKKQIKEKCFNFWWEDKDVYGDDLVEFAINETERIMEKKMDKLRDLNKHLRLVLRTC